MQTQSGQDTTHGPEDTSFVRTGDGIGLATSANNGLLRQYLSVEFGSQLCSVVPEPTDGQEPTVVFMHTFEIAAAISVHAISGWNEKERQQSGSHVVLYGQAILLDYGPPSSPKYIRCLPSHSGKMDAAINVKDYYSNHLIGFMSPNDKSYSIDATCWYTIHPASNLRSDGEKVRAGDEVYLINVGTNRYLSLAHKSLSNAKDSKASLDIDEESFSDYPVAAFSPWPWTVDIIRCRSEQLTGYLNGGDPILIKALHNQEEHLTIPLGSSEDLLKVDKDSKKLPSFEPKAVQTELRSLWMVMLSGLSYGRAFIEWGQLFRLRHLCSGLYLGIDANQVVLVDGKNATNSCTSFCFMKKEANVSPSHRPVIVVQPQQQVRTSMGTPTIKLGESEVYLFHINTAKWVGMEMSSVSLRRVRTGFHGLPRAVLCKNFNQNLGLCLGPGYTIALGGAISNELETIMRALSLQLRMMTDLKKKESSSHEERTELYHLQWSTEEKSLSKLTDLSMPLGPPNKDRMSLATYQEVYMRFKNRQTRLQNHGTVKMTFAMLQQAVAYYTADPSNIGFQLQQILCKILTFMVQRNRYVCQKFANEECLDNMINLINSKYLLHPMLNMMDCMLEESPELLVSLSKKHLTDLFNLLYRNGRDPKVMNLLGKLCVCQGVAMREKQQQISHHLKTSCDLLLNTSLNNKMYSMYCDLFLCTKMDKQLGSRWYFELQWTPSKCSGDCYIRVGCATYLSFSPFPRSKGLGITRGAIGDSLDSIGFDGRFVWMNGEKYMYMYNTSGRKHAKLERQSCQDDEETDCSAPTVYGCCLDLENGLVRFTLNGKDVPIQVQYEVDDDVVIVPSVSFTGGIENARLCLGEDNGMLMYNPPKGFQPLCQFNNNKDIQLHPFLDVGDSQKRILNGPHMFADLKSYKPSPNDTSQIPIPSQLVQFVHKLAVEFHNNWAFCQIDSGYRYAPATDHTLKLDSCLCPFDELPVPDRDQKQLKARDYIATLISIGCRISHKTQTSLVTTEEELPEEPYQQCNGFKPHPLPSSEEFPSNLLALVNYLAELSHSRWSKQQMTLGWKSGLVTRNEVKQDCKLVPFKCLSESCQKILIDKEKLAVQTLMSLGFLIKPPPADQLKDELSYTQIPYRTFRGQHISYCTKKGKWYFQVKLLKGMMSRIGWATVKYPSSSLLGSDAFSYAIDGHHACKWHDKSSEKFGQLWKEGDIITCLLDLDNKTMTFARDNQLLASPLGATVAFSGFSEDLFYLPAVSVFVGEQVQMILTPERLDSDILENITAGYEAIEASVKNPIPLWYSNPSHQFKNITTDHPYLVATPSNTSSITVTTKSIIKPLCLRFNMGVNVHLTDTPEVTDSLQEEEEEELPVGISVVIAGCEDPKLVYVGWATADFIYHQELYHASAPEVLYGQTVKVVGASIKTGASMETDDPNSRNESERASDEREIERISDEADLDASVNESLPADKVLAVHREAYLVKVHSLFNYDAVMLATETKINCKLNPKTGHIVIETALSDNRVPVEFTVTTPCKLFPVIIANPSHLEHSFDLNPIEGCRPYMSAVAGEHYDKSFPSLLPLMKAMTVAETRWHKMDDNSRLYPTLSSPLAIPLLPSYRVASLNLPLEQSVMKLSELVEAPQLYSFHIETLKTLCACCTQDNSEAAEQVSQLITWDQLLHSTGALRWDYTLRTQCFDLLYKMYLEHEVTSCLLMQRNFIFAADASADTSKRRSSLSQPLSNISGYNRQDCSLLKNYKELSIMKDQVFKLMDQLLSDDVLTCRMLSIEYRNCLFYPLLKAIDSFLVLGMLKDSEKLLTLLHPSLAPPGHSAPFYLLTMPSDQHIRSILCDILDHLCDYQLQERINHIIKFASSFVDKLQVDQRGRSEKKRDQISAQIIQELNTPTEKQVIALLSFSGNGCPTSKALQKELQSFHTRLTNHCGDIHGQGDQPKETTSSIIGKLEKLVKRVYAGQTDALSPSERVVKLQKVIVYTMLRWSRESVCNVQIAEKIFDLLYRQFHESEKLIEALRGTYVVENESEMCSSGINEFRSALGQVREMLKIGFGKKEEKVLEAMLHTLCKSPLFFRHPDLLRVTDIHTLVINVIKSHTSFSSTSSVHQQTDAIITQKLKFNIDNEGFAGPIEECCKFLSTFAQTSSQNQIALFKHLPYLLQLCTEHTYQLESDTCGPLDVAIASITNNASLVCDLSEDMLSQVIFLMQKMIYINGEEKLSRMSLMGGSFSMEWCPIGAEKCLRFLNAAVWVDGETIRQNAITVIQLMIQHPDCLGPSYIGQSLTLVDLFTSSLACLRQNTSTKGMTRRTSSKILIQQDSTVQRPPSPLDFNVQTATLTLTFYSSLVRFLGSCATPNSESRDSDTCKYSSDHILPFLRSLVPLDTLKKLLQLQMTSNHNVSPVHKEAMLIFLDRVYTIDNHLFLLELLKDIFLPDVKVVLAIEEAHKDSAHNSTYELVDYFRYISDHLLPLLERCLPFFAKLSDQLSLLFELMIDCYQLSKSTRVHASYGRKICNFIMTVTKFLPPQSILKLLPKFVIDISSKDCDCSNALKILTAHYHHYSQYYSSGILMTSAFKLSPPSQKEKVYISVLFSWLLEISHHNPSSLITECLQALSSSLLPETLVPSLEGLAAELSADHDYNDDMSFREYIERVELSSEWMSYVYAFAEYIHECWVYQMVQVEGWMYSALPSRMKTHTMLRPYGAVPDEKRQPNINQIKQLLKILFFHGCVLVHSGSAALAGFAPLKRKNLCLMAKSGRATVDNPKTWKSYDPSPLDLSEKIDLPLYYQSIIDSTVSVIERMNNKKKPRSRAPSSSVYDPINFMYENSSGGRTAGFVKDFLKFMKVKGFVCQGSFACLPGPLQDILNQTADYKPFAGQLFQDFLALLQSQCGCGLENCKCHAHKQQLFPILSCYLNTHASYFNPNAAGTERRPSYASLDEKLQIAKMLYHVHVLVSNYVKEMFSNGKSSTVPKSEAPADSDLQAVLSLKEKNAANLNKMKSLLLGLVKAVDTSETEVILEMNKFFNSVAHFLKSFPKSVAEVAVNSSNELDRVILVYSLHCLMPTLTALFNQYKEAATSQLLFKQRGKEGEQWPNIFKDIYNSVYDHTQIFIESCTLSSIGQCLSVMCQVYPRTTCEAAPGQFQQQLLFGIDIQGMMSLLVAAASATQMPPEKVSLVTLVIIPVMTSFTIPSSSQHYDISQVDRLLKLTLRLIFEYQGNADAVWMAELCNTSYKLAEYCSSSLFNSHLLPLMSSLSGRSCLLWQEEQLVFSSLHVQGTDVLLKQREFAQKLKLFVRDLHSFLLFLVKFSEKNAQVAFDFTDQTLFQDVSVLINFWFSSQRFAVQMNSTCNPLINQLRGVKGQWNLLISFTLMIVQQIPPHVIRIFDDLGHLFDQGDSRSLSSLEKAVADTVESHHLRTTDRNISLIDEDLLSPEDRERIKKDREVLDNELMAFKKNLFQVQSFARVQHFVKQTQAVSLTVRGRWKEIVSKQRREGMVKCLKAVPFFRLKKHRAVNLFLQEYCSIWLADCQHSNTERLCEQLLDKEDYDQKQKKTCCEDPLEHLFYLFKMQASAQEWQGASSSLYNHYATAITQHFEKIMRSQKNKDNVYGNFNGKTSQLISKQEQLMRKRVPEMLLSVIGASNGNFCSLIHVTIRLGIMLLEGGNTMAQNVLFNELKTMDGEFWTSVSGLIASCSVLDWSSYERNQTTSETNIAERVFKSSDQAIDLFRFLQLLCEGHNEGFQNLLRSQEKRTTTVNIVVATVDYLLKLQESIRDFYWHHAHQDALKLPARGSFQIAFKVARQLFRTLTEYVQGPCIGNQEALAKSRLWDALSGFLHIFVALQQKLFRHTSHIELLRDMLDLQEEFFIFLLSMLEGSTKSSVAGQCMLSTFEECYEHFEELVKFYHIFIKLKDSTTSKAFEEYDLNKDGLISYREFERALNAQQNYTKHEIDYLIQLADTNKDGLLDYQEFTERFHQPSHNLGFHLCALLRQLNDILPGDARLTKFIKASSELCQHFEHNMGCIEMAGRSGHIERVYFHIKTSHRQQWDDQAIKEARKEFLFSSDFQSQREKLTGFVNFCEDTIYQMNYSDELLRVEQEEKEKRADKHRDINYPQSHNTNSVLGRLRTKVVALRATNPRHAIFRILDFLTFIWLTLFLGIVMKPVSGAYRRLRVSLIICWHKGEGPLKYPSRQPSFLRRYFSSCYSPIRSYIPRVVYSLHSSRALFASNYYKIKGVLLITTFLINLFVLLTAKSSYESTNLNSTNESTNLTSLEMTLASVLKWLTYSHNILSCLLLLSFWNLKVPLIVFKAEKEVVRRLDNHTSSRNCTLSTLDHLVIKSPSFPRYFWDKEVKERVLSKCATDDKPAMAWKLGMVSESKFRGLSKKEEFIDAISSFADIRYLMWHFAIISSNGDFRYQLGYCLVSVMGVQLNVFFFSFHLLDLMFQSKTLVTVFRSLMINVKQLLMTLAMTGVVVYMYTVVAFIYFRKFYVHQKEEGEVRDNCDSMLSCYLFHMDQGLRSGGGIADVISSAFEDKDYYLMRLFFDMTFFFVVIVILIAIFQGLIIDAFGELRKKDDIVAEELRNKCFICGLSKSEFETPHEFDVHIHNHHSLRDYMFFLMHLISKPVTEFTGQESHVWERYLRQQWDFFPSGTCFQLQEKERQVAAQPSPVHTATIGQH